MVSWLRANGKILFRGAALLLAGAAAGFGLGLFFAVPAGPGCQESDLTPVPDTGFVSPAPEAAPASSLPQEEPMPEKWVCLTFDDGPSKTTPAVLDALNAAGVKATFFVVATGYNEKYLPLIADAAAAGHQIALHSASHEYSDIYQSADAYWQDIELLKERISPYVNTASLHYLRFPGGSTNTVSRRYGGRGVMAELKQQCAEKGYAYVDWNVCAEDAVGGLPQDVVADDEVGDQAQCKAEPAGGGDKLYRDNQYGGEDQPQQDLFLFVCHRKTSRWNGERRWLKENLAVPLHLAAGGEDRLHGLPGVRPVGEGHLQILGHKAHPDNREARNHIGSAFHISAALGAVHLHAVI